MIKKLTTKTTIQSTEVAERTAQITCGGYCSNDCRFQPTLSIVMYEENYEMIGY